MDSSSGAIGTAVNNAVDALVPFIAKAPADVDLRKKWLDRLWQAIEDDDIPYIEILACRWGSLCHSPDLASQWADDLMTPVRITWSEERRAGGGINNLFDSRRHHYLEIKTSIWIKNVMNIGAELGRPGSALFVRSLPS